MKYEKVLPAWRDEGKTIKRSAYSWCFNSSQVPQITLNYEDWNADDWQIVEEEECKCEDCQSVSGYSKEFQGPIEECKHEWQGNPQYCAKCNTSRMNLPPKKKITLPSKLRVIHGGEVNHVHTEYMLHQIIDYLKEREVDE